MLRGLAGGGLGLLVPVLAVDQRCEAVPCVTIHPLPDIEHRAAGSVHQYRTSVPQPLEVVDRDAECRHDDHVFSSNTREIEWLVGIVSQDADTHGPQVVVDVGVVDDLTHQKEPAVGKLAPAFVGVVHRAIHPVAEPELLGQPESQRPALEGVVARPHLLHQRAGVVSRQIPLDLLLEAESAAEIGRFHAGI